MAKKFVTNKTKEEDVLFVALDKLGKGQTKDKSVILKEGDSIEGVITRIADSPKYKKIYQLDVKEYDKPVVITGKTDLVKNMGHLPNTKPGYIVKEGDLVRITYLGSTQTQKGNTYYNFEVGVAQ